MDPRQLTDEDSSTLRKLLRRNGRRWRTDEPRVQAALFFDAYATCLARPVAAALMAGAPLPDVHAAACRVEIDRNGLTRAVRVARTVEATDPLATAGRLLVDGHLLPLVGALTAVAPLGRPALTAMIVDAFAASLLDAGDPDEARRLAAEFALRNDADLPGPPRFLTVARPDGPRTVHLRRSCCLAYRLVSAVHCASCPLPDESTRALRLGVTRR